MKFFLKMTQGFFFKKAWLKNGLTPVWMRSCHARPILTPRTRFAITGPGPGPASQPASASVRPSVRASARASVRRSGRPAASPHLHTARRSIPNAQSAEQLRWRTARRVRVMGRRDATPSVQEDLAPSFLPSLARSLPPFLPPQQTLLHRQHCRLLSFFCFCQPRKGFCKDTGGFSPAVPAMAERCKVETKQSLRLQPHSRSKVQTSSKLLLLLLVEPTVQERCYT